MESTAVAEKTEALATIEYTPSQLLELAVQKDLDIDKLERLMGMQERWEARQAKKSFYEALSKFQETVPELIKSKIVDFTSRAGVRVLYAYAPLSAIVAQIKKPLSDCGLSYRWEQEAVGDQIAITAIITHLDGHSESTRIESVLDETGVKNAVQARGSTIQYLQRYSLIGALGLATAESDVDANIITQGIKQEILPDDFEHDSDAYPSAGKHAEGATGAKADPKPWREIPSGYLDLIIERGKNKDLKYHAIAERKDRIEGKASLPAKGTTDAEYEDAPEKSLKDELLFLLECPGLPEEFVTKMKSLIKEKQVASWYKNQTIIVKEMIADAEKGQS